MQNAQLRSLQALPKSPKFISIFFLFWTPTSLRKIIKTVDLGFVEDKEEQKDGIGRFCLTFRLAASSET